MEAYVETNLVWKKDNKQTKHKLDSNLVICSAS